VVLGLLGMILYGAYLILQRGPAASPVLPEAPPFAAMDPVAPAAAGLAAPQVDIPAPASVAAAAAPAAMEAAVSPPTAPVDLPPSAPTYLSAQSAPPPTNDDALPADSVAGMPPPSGSIPATPASSAPATPQPPAPFPAAINERAAAVGVPSTAFASAWADAHDKLAAGRFAEALAVLSAWHDDSSLGLEESQRLEELLGQLAGTVIYSQEDMLLPPHRVAPGETLDAIAAGHRVPWQLLAKINGIDDPQRLVPGEAIKLVRGPFDAVVSVSRRRLSLQVNGNYAGMFPVVVGRGIQERVGSALAVTEIRRDAGPQPAGASPVTPGAVVQQVAGHVGTKSIVLNGGLRIESADDPAAMSDSAPDGVLIVAPRDLDDLVDILGEGSRVLIRQ
jgi:hypothetical protein